MPHFHVLNKVTRERSLTNIVLKTPILFCVGMGGLLGFIVPLVGLTYEDYRHGIMIGEALSDFHHYLSSIISSLLMLIASYLISVRILKGVKLELENFEIKERFRMITEQSPSVYELYDLEGLQLEVNKAYEDMWKFPEGRERTVRKFNVLKSQEVVNTGLMKYVKKAYNGENITVPPYQFDPTGISEARGVGRIRWLNTKIYPLKDGNGEVTNIVITHEDITDQKMAEDRLFKNERKQNAMISNISDTIGVLNADGITIYKSSNIKKHFGWDPEDLVGKSAFDIVHTDDLERVKETFLENMQINSSKVTLEFRYRCKNGIFLPVELTAINQLDNPNINGILINYRDISQRKQDEIKLQQLVQEKELLLQEVNHRVKNNLAILISLANLQAESTNDMNVKEVLGNFSNRIYSISAMYNDIQSQGYEKISPIKYLNNIVNNLNEFYGSSEINIKFETNFEENYNINIKEAFPLGMIVGELVSNSIKYAFQENHGIISISFKRIGENNCLEIHDNGKGIEDDYKTGLGLTLVTSFIEAQLNGTINIDKNKGTRIKMVYPAL